MSTELDRDGSVFGDRFVEYDGTYLLSHSIGRAIRGSRQIASGYFDTWERHTVDAWPRWLEGVDGFRSALAALLGSSARSFCPQSNVSSGLTKILDSLRHEFDRPTVLISEDAFPSLGFVCTRSPYDVRFVPAEADVFDPSMWRELLAGVDVVVLTHVHSNTGQRIPVTDIAADVRAAGATTVVDVAQSAGIIPIDLGEWERCGIDAVVGSCVKWLSGGPGAGWLWLTDRTIERSVPTDVGWFSHQEPFEFDIHDYRDADDALRFWGGSPTVLPFLVAAHSIATISSIGVERIREHNTVLLDHLVERLGDRVVSPHAVERRSGTAIVRSPSDAVERLGSAGFAVDHRHTGLRLSPHLDTTCDDIDRLVDALG